MYDFEQELKMGFLDEAAQSVADVEQCFLTLESDPNNLENINKIFRLAHNLKGSSKAVGFDDFGAFTHQFESLILRVKNQELKTTPKVVNLLLQANDHVSKMIAGLKENLNATFDSESLLQEMRNITDAEDELSPATEDSQQVPETIAEVELESLPELDELATEVSTIDTQTQVFENTPAVSQSRESAEVVQQSMTEPVVEVVPVSAAVESEKLDSAKKVSASRTAASEESIRVTLSKVETLINFVGEMVILQSVMREQIMGSESLLLKRTVHHLGKVSKEIQDIAMGLRMVPVKPTFQKMQRIVRDTAMALKKDVSIQLQGEETEVDKTVLEKMNDPLVHLIRNSVDHGIEDSETRVKKGKSAKGQVWLRAVHRSGKLIIEVQDDGGGIDPEKLKKKATEKGILKPGAVLSEKEALNLIFAPGFSTKEQVTDVSGRGVGMDVVKTNIQELGGEIEIETSLGVGSTFRVILPLTLAILDALVLTYSNERFVIPLNHVFETVKPENSMIQRNSGLGDILLLRGENMPVIRLGDFFGLKNSLPFEQMIAIVIKTTSKPFAIVVDDILGQFQVVQKQLGPELQGIKGVSGSTILGDGKPALILEPQDLLKRKIASSYQAPAMNQTNGSKSA